MSGGHQQRGFIADLVTGQQLPVQEEESRFELGEYHHLGDAPAIPVSDHEETFKVLKKFAKRLHGAGDLGGGVVNTNNVRDFENRREAASDGSIWHGVPAGYTYLFQLAAHDVVHTSLSFRNLGERPRLPRNLRRQALNLETLYGGGPGACPHAYSFLGNGSIKLLTGPTRSGASLTEDHSDFARVKYPPSASVNPNAQPNTVLAADPRNDDNLILAQLTVLMHKIHNKFVDCLNRNAPGLKNSPQQVDEVARFVFGEIFRTIVRDDLLPRILHPNIHSSYSAQRERLFPAEEEGSAPLEFAFGAGRVGHAMIRPAYNLNGLSGGDGLLLKLDDVEETSLRNPGSLPHDTNWTIDWGRFFWKNESEVPEGANWALRFGNHIAAPLHARPENDDGATSAMKGLPLRDLIRAASGQILNAAGIKQLIEQGLSNGPTQQFEEVAELCLPSLQPEEREGMIEKHLGQDLTQHENLLPLPLFLQIEAMSHGNGGRYLGPVGSMLIAEGMHAAYEHSSERWRMGVREEWLNDWKLIATDGVDIKSFSDLMAQIQDIPELLLVDSITSMEIQNG